MSSTEDDGYGSDLDTEKVILTYALIALANIALVAIVGVFGCMYSKRCRDSVKYCQPGADKAKNYTGPVAHIEENSDKAPLEKAAAEVKLI